MTKGKKNSTDLASVVFGGSNETVLVVRELQSGDLLVMRLNFLNDLTSLRDNLE